MIHGRYIGQGGDLSEIKKIREEAFAGLNYDLHEELDPMALNAIVDVDGVLAGAGRLVLDMIEDRFYVDNICILKEYRGKQYGEFVLRMLADKADQCKADMLWAEVPGFAADFFKKMFFENAAERDDFDSSENETAETRSDGLMLMRAGIQKFYGCCHGGCASACKTVMQSGEDRRHS